MSSTPSTPTTGADRRSTAPPYAFPPTGNALVARVLQSARGQVGPYVPAPWRGTPAVESVRAVPIRSVTPLAVEALLAPQMPKMPPSYPTPAYLTPLGSPVQEDGIREASGLPWIDAFLTSTPAMSIRAVDEPVAFFALPSPEAMVDEAVPAAGWPLSAAGEEVSTPSDAWALDEAAAQMRAFADELRERERLAVGSGMAVQSSNGMSSSDPISAWGDADEIDMRPQHQAHTSGPDRGPALGASHSIEPWAHRASRSDNEDAEAAAQALEVLARRVRHGEISLAGSEPRLGDTAALTAALAALLGVRR